MNTVESELKRIDPKRFKQDKRLAQQERRLYSLGATEETIQSITDVLNYFDEKEFSRTIPARDAFYQRLVALTQGQTIPIVVFNCLDFLWRESKGSYPLATILDDTSTVIAGYFKGAIQESTQVLASLSPKGDEAVDLCIVVPDSELVDARVFPFAQTEERRTQISEQVKVKLTAKMADATSGEGNSVMFWSEYCERYELQSPAMYTAQNANRLFQAELAGDENPKEKNIFSGVRNQINHSYQYLRNQGLSVQYLQWEFPPDEFERRIIWYCAMYMGEGQALADSGAIALNLEDLRVPKWYNVGSNDRLPIVTPVNPNKYYQWRSSKKTTMIQQ